jgi:Cu/Ag efflux protein CusF
MVGAVVAAVVCAGALSADEIAGKVKKVDMDKNKITLTIENKDSAYDMAKDVKVLALSGKGNQATYQPTEDGIKGLKEGTSVTLLREPQGGKDLVTEIKIVVEMPKKKKKNKNI